MGGGTMLRPQPGSICTMRRISPNTRSSGFPSRCVTCAGTQRSRRFSENGTCGCGYSVPERSAVGHIHKGFGMALRSIEGQREPSQAA